MPRWPAYALGAFAMACTYPAVTTPAPSTEVATPYVARGNEPGWIVTIGDERIDYVGDYGETEISVPRPEARATSNGLRYETPRLVVEITHSRCNDDMSGHGYRHQVLLIADGRSFRGCGGERMEEWDV
ncbi:MAG: hypothetical protein ACFBQW_05845 [Sphingomonadaceae bacterium]